MYKKINIKIILNFPRFCKLLFQQVTEGVEVAAGEDVIYRFFCFLQSLATKENEESFKGDPNYFVYYFAWTLLLEYQSVPLLISIKSRLGRNSNS